MITPKKLIKKKNGLQEFEDTKGVITIRKSKKNRQHNGPKEKEQRDKQRSTKHTHKTEDRVTRTPLKTRVVLRCSLHNGI